VSPKPSTLAYRVICISLYKSDLAHLDTCVSAAKETRNKSSRSDYIRAALRAYSPEKYLKDKAHDPGA
jgi:metal-responsive CopG/Arc/MetJ family transcriptional regulator